MTKLQITLKMLLSSRKPGLLLILDFQAINKVVSVDNE